MISKKHCLINKKSILSAVLAAVLSIGILSGCAGNSTSSGNNSAAGNNSFAGNSSGNGSSENSGEILTDGTDENGDGLGENAAEPGLSLLTNYLTDDAYAEADKWETCDDTALASVMKKAESGEKVTIACIGGSITEGTISKGSRDSEISSAKSYAPIFFEWWTERFPDTEFEFINAGIGGTDSYLGVHRLKEDVLDYNPDLVLVEYAVNDGETNAYKRSYENLVRNILNYNPDTAVMLLFMAQTNGSTAQGNQVLIGYTYKLPMVSYANVISYYMNNGTYSAGELSGDTVHPSALGHALCGEILWTYLNNVYSCRADFGEINETIPSPITKSVYENACILDSDDITPDELGSFEEAGSSTYFPNGWAATEGNDGITFTATFRNLGILYINQVSGDPGKFEVIIDGETVRTIDAKFTNGWGNAVTPLEVYTSDEAAEHTVTIKKAEDSEGSEFKLLGLLAS